MNVLSLFDGISCGRVALERAGIFVHNYYASEIEPYAIKVAKYNYPDIIQVGDVMKINYKDGILSTEYGNMTTGKIDLLIGGSPCTNFSIAKNHKAKVKKEKHINEGEGWKLFMEYVRILHEIKPKYFLYENNYRIPKEIQANISKALNVKPILINSSLVSAQNRKRLYWTNIPNIKQPQNKYIYIKDIYIPDSSLERTDMRIEKTAKWCKNYIQYAVNDKNLTSQAFRLYFMDGKAPTQARCRTESKCNILIDKNNINTYKIISPEECERLQTLPDGYTNIGISKTKRFELIGNGWTVDVIAHIFRSIKEDNIL